MLKDTVGFKFFNQIIALGGKEDKLFKKLLNNDGVKKLIVSLNTHTQLGDESVDSDGNPLVNAYSGSTTYSLFDPKGRGGQRYRLFDTGDYWASFKVEVFEGYIVISSNPLKEDDNLFDMFGENIEGLTDDSLKILMGKVLEIYLKFFRDGIRQRSLGKV